MKTIDEIKDMTLEDLEKISLDPGIATPDGLAERSMALVRNRRQRSAVIGLTGIAAALLVGLFTLTNRAPEPKDTFSDPYLAYAEIEKAFNKIGNAVSASAEAVDASREQFDKSIGSIYNTKR